MHLKVTLQSYVCECKLNIYTSSSNFLSFSMARLLFCLIFFHSLTIWWISFIFIFRMVFSVLFFVILLTPVVNLCRFVCLCVCHSTKFVSFVQSSVTTRDTHTLHGVLCSKIFQCVCTVHVCLYFHGAFHSFFVLSFISALPPHLQLFFSFFVSRCCYFLSRWDLVAIQNERKATVITWRNIDRTCQSKGVAWLC